MSYFSSGTGVCLGHCIIFCSALGSPPGMADATFLKLKLVYRLVVVLVGSSPRDSGPGGQKLGFIFIQWGVVLNHHFLSCRANLKCLFFYFYYKGMLHDKKKILLLEFELFYRFSALLFQSLMHLIATYEVNQICIHG